MNVNMKYLKDESGNTISPVVSTDSVFNGSDSLTSLLTNIGYGIVAFGVSSNITYIKYDNGLMIQYGRNKSGIYTLPYSFNTSYTVYAFGTPWSRQQDYMHCTQCYTDGSSITICNFWEPADAASGGYDQSVDACWIVIGRYK